MWKTTESEVEKSENINQYSIKWKEGKKPLSELADNIKKALYVGTQHWWDDEENSTE
jgi:hypothetical protein